MKSFFAKFSDMIAASKMLSGVKVNSGKPPLVCVLLLFVVNHAQAQVKLGNNPTVINPSALLELESSNRGLLLPRMTTAQRNSIPSPASGLMIFNTDVMAVEANDGTAGAPHWNLASGLVGSDQIADQAVTDAKIFSAGAEPGKVLTANGFGGVLWQSTTLIQDNDANTKVETEKNPNENLVRIMLNGSEKVVFRANRIDLLNNGGTNAFVGENAGAANTGSGNAAFGNKALESNTSGASNTAVGEFALRLNTTGGSNTVVGSQALKNNTTGADNIAIGKDAGIANTTGAGNVFVGRNAGAANTTSGFNTFVGNGAGFSNTSGGGNVFLGSAAGSANTTGFSNTYLGFNAGTQSTTAFANVMVGAWVGWKNTTGSNNVFIGGGGENTTGADNVFVGGSSAGKNTVGNQNTYIGPYAGNQNVTGSGNVFIGHRAGEPELGSNKLYIDNSSGAVPLIWGDFAADRVGINRIATTNTLEVGGEASKATPGAWLGNSDARLKKDIQPIDPDKALQTVLALQGVSYLWNDSQTGMPRPEGIQYGFTAQNIQSVLPELVSTDAKGFLQTAYGTYDPMFVEAFRALTQRLEVLEKANERLTRQVDALSQENAALKVASTGKK